MAALSDADMLASTRAAIQAIMAGGQEYTLADGTRVRRADLQVLQDRENTLLSRIAASGGATFKPVGFGSFS